MDNQPKKFSWLWGIVVIIVVLGLIQWFMNKKPSAPFNAYGTATSTWPDYGNASTSPDATSNTPAPSASTPTPSTAAPSTPAPTTNNSSVKNLMHTITIETNKGTIVFQTYDADAPKAAANFVSLAQKGFYNNTIFHRVIKGFMIQGGDPTGTGTGGPGYKFDDELNASTDSYNAGYKRGVVAMANSGPNTNGSQFFIMHADYPLPHLYTIFGKVISGMDVVDAIATSPTGPNDRPTSDIVMKKVTVASN